MKNNKILWVGVSLLAIAGLGFLGYKLLKKSGTKSNDPEKNNRNIVITKA
jgi:hypothetical protein